ncbi:alpha/beta hydrolase [Microlunatus antarcticus]|uniref:Alpha-beta hydrolase superfamily lysophospholipase n=1 Tax=Microlunatus antarcticus TaxID=53388 RepID=A0A7W5JX10_9ACTN|nr:alpha/beta hydrolase [Microlunatus antarcticus]MBB3327869.1 alpha-beta hydrolase superfamily lysophospholipase [Microlunatus antarcticus]
MSTTTLADVRPDAVTELDTVEWREPAGLNPRGTLVVLGGRGEPPEVYARFAARLSADAYRVVVVSTADPAGPAARTEITALLADPALVAPVVLVGSDTGARLALDLVGTADARPAALVLAGLPVGGPAAGASWPTDEIGARTACPTHQGVMRQSSRGSLADRPVLPRLARSLDLRGVPVLAVHGADDAISPLPAVLDVYRGAGVPEVHVVAEGRHDILNDVTHRSVAATLVLFLERLRLSSADDRGLAPLVVTTSTARPGR